jgi:hypothetical protein
MLREGRRSLSCARAGFGLFSGMGEMAVAHIRSLAWMGPVKKHFWPQKQSSTGGCSNV